MDLALFTFFRRITLFFLLLIFSSSIVFSIGFHYPDEIYDGNFTSDFNFTGDVTFFDSEIGIGTSSPSSNLHIVSSGSDSEIFVERASGAQVEIIAQSSKGVIGTSSNHNLDFKTNDNVALSISSTGNVGVGVLSPSSKLHINGTTYSTDLILSNKVSCGVLYTDGSGNVLCGTQNTSLNLTGSGSAGYLSRFSNTSNLESSSVYDDGSGNIGIGTTSPSSALEINNGELTINKSYYSPGINISHGGTTSGGRPAIHIAQESGASGSTAIHIQRGRTDGRALLSYGTTGVSSSSSTPEWFSGLTGNLGLGSGYYYTIGTVNDGSISLGTGSDMKGYFVIGSDGNVGINTTTPSYALEVHSTSTTEAAARFTGGSGLDADYRNGQILIGDGSANSEGSLRYDWTAGDLFIENSWNSPGAHIIFRSQTVTDPVEILRLTGDGRVGINTSVPSYALEVNSISNNEAAARFTGGSELDTDYRDGQILIGNGGGNSEGSLRYNFTAGDFYIENTWNNADSDIIFRSQTVTTPVEILRLKGDGDVGIGTSDPSAKLEVSSGNLRLTSNYNLEWGGSNTVIYGHDTQGINFLTQGGTRLKIEDGGDVGIGTSNPSHTLDVDGNTRITGELEVETQFDLGSSSATTDTADLFIAEKNYVNAEAQRTYLFDLDSDFIGNYTGSGVRTHYGINYFSNSNFNVSDKSAVNDGIVSTLYNDQLNRGDNLSGQTAFRGTVYSLNSGQVSTSSGAQFSSLSQGSDASITSSRGVVGDSNAYYDSNMQDSRGVSGSSTTLFGANISNSYGGWFLSRRSAGDGTITNGHGVRSECNHATTCYGIRLVLGSSATTAWGVYEGGADKNYFSAPVGIGDTTPEGSLQLDVNGQIGANEYCDESGNNCVDGTYIGNISGSGTSGYLPYYTGIADLATSPIYTDGTGVSIGITSQIGSFRIRSPTRVATYAYFDNDLGYGFNFSTSGSGNHNVPQIRLTGGTDLSGSRGIGGIIQSRSVNDIYSLNDAVTIFDSRTNSDGELSSANLFTWNENDDARMVMNHNGNVSIGDDTPDASLKLDVEGQVGATDYCDEDGANCFNASTNTAGVSCSDSGTREHMEVYALLTSSTSCSCSGSTDTYSLKTCNDGTVSTILSGIQQDNSCDNGCICFTEDTKVQMLDGSYKDIEDVLIGEFVIGKDGKVNEVLGYHRPKLGTRKLVSINGGEYFITEDHPLLTEDGWKSLTPEMTKKNTPKTYYDLNVTKLEVGDILIKESGNEVIETLDSKHDDPSTQLYSLVVTGDDTFTVYDYITVSEEVE